MRTPTSFASICALFLLAFGLGSCREGSDTAHAITKSRTYQPAEEEIHWNAGPTERFPVRASSGAAHAAGKTHLHWKTPAGWKELAPSSLRQANFLVAGDERAECYLTILASDGGGIEANVNRWRQQMSLTLASTEEIAALPTAPMFGQPAVLVELDGTWAGMGGDAHGEGYRMIALAQVADGSARFLKMIGPADIVTPQVAAFRELAASFEEDASDHGKPPAPATGANAGSGGGALTWSAPEGWERGPEKAMREVTFYAGSDGERAECYVSILGGAGGGVSANINRWCQQMGAERLDEATIQGLPRIPMLGGEGVLVEVEGRYVGMGDDDVPDALLLGAVRLLPRSSVFVKMIGPRATIEREREAFTRFCESLEMEG